MPWSDESAPDGPARDIHTDRRVGQQTRTARTAEATAIGAGGVVVDGGDITVKTGGSISAEYPSGRAAAFFGPLIFQDTGVPDGHGLLVQADDDDAGRDIFRAKYSNGQRRVDIGENPGDDGAGAADVFVANSVRVGINSQGEELRIQAHRGGPLRIYGGGSGTGASSISIVTFEGGLLKLQTVDNGNIDLTSDGNIDGDANGDIIFDATGTGQIHGDTLAQVTSLGQAALAGQGGSFILRQDTGLAANMYMGTDGRVYRSTSSLRYKTDVQDLSVDPDVVLQLRPRSWIHKPVPQCPDWLHEQHGDNGTCPAMQETPEPDPAAERVVGFIAEELVEIGLADFVEFDAEGQPEAIYYDRLTAALIPLVQQQQAQITAVTERLTALEAALTLSTPEPEEA